MHLGATRGAILKAKYYIPHNPPIQTNPPVRGMLQRCDGAVEQQPLAQEGDQSTKYLGSGPRLEGYSVSCNAMTGSYGHTPRCGHAMASRVAFAAWAP